MSLGSNTPSQAMGNGSGQLSLMNSLTNLSLNTTYYFRAVAQNSFGTTYGSILSFTTLAQSSSGTTPTVFTNSVTIQSQNSVSLNGTVNPNNSLTNVWFEWGSSSALGSSVGNQSVGNGIGTVNFSYSLSGLSPNAVYYFRAVAQNSYGTSYGSIVSFTTQYGSGQGVMAPSAYTNPVSLVMNTTASFSGSVNPNGSFTNVWFEYGTVPSLGSSAGSQQIGSGFAIINFEYALSGLQPNTVYYYRTVAQNSSGSSYGATYSFVTNGYPTNSVSGSAPLVFTKPVEINSQSSVTLNGSVNPNNAVSTAWFEWGNSLSLGSSTNIQPISLGNSSVNFSYVLSNLNPNATYYYRAVVSNPNGTGYGSIISFVTNGSGVQFVNTTGGGIPIAHTLNASFVAATVVLLRSSIDPSGFPTTTYFE